MTAKVTTEHNSFMKEFDQSLIKIKDGKLFNSTQRHERHKNFDKELVDIARQELVGVGDLMSRGLVTPLPHIGVTLSLYERIGDMTGADVSMDGQKRGNNDQVTFEEVGTPVPVFYKDYEVNFRQLAALDAGGSNFVDSTINVVAAYNTTYKMEDALFNGLSEIVVAGNAIPGYTTYSERNTYTLPKAWTAATGDEIHTYVLAMVQKLRDHNFFGPYVLYVPNGYSTVLDRKFSTAYGSKSIREELLGIDGLKSIRVAKQLAANNVVLIQMDKRVVDIAMAQGLGNIMMKKSPLQEAYRQMAIMIHRLKSDKNGQCGICHGSV